MKYILETLNWGPRSLIQVVTMCFMQASTLYIVPHQVRVCVLHVQLSIRADENSRSSQNNNGINTLTCHISC
jgi:hypothetical protein